VQSPTEEIVASVANTLTASASAGVARVAELLSVDVRGPAVLLESLVAHASRLEGGELLRTRALDERTATAVIRCPDGEIVLVSLMTQPSDGAVVGLGVRPLAGARPWAQQRAFVGAAWGTRGGEQQRIRRRGCRRLDPDDPVEETTLFRAGSIAKLVTAAGVLALAEAGELRLDDPLWTWLPQCFHGPTGEIGPSIRQVLGHRGGFVDGPGHGAGHDGARLVRASTMARPGPVRYCNTGYEVLGVLLEHSTGVPAVDWLASHVLAPLGLARSALGPAEGEDEDEDLRATAALGYGIDEGFVYAASTSCDILPTAAGLSTTIGDLLSLGHWLAVPSDAGCASGPRLPARIAEQLRRAEWAMLAPSGAAGVLSWGGSWPGFMAGLAILPGTGTAGMLVNTDGVDAPSKAARLARGLIQAPEAGAWGAG